MWSLQLGLAFRVKSVWRDVYRALLYFSRALFFYYFFIEFETLNIYKLLNKTDEIMEKVKLYWRVFTISAFILVAISVVAVSKPHGDSVMDEISIAFPFFTLYYIIFGFFFLQRFEEKNMGKKKNEHDRIRYDK